MHGPHFLISKKFWPNSSMRSDMKRWVLLFYDIFWSYSNYWPENYGSGIRLAGLSLFTLHVLVTYQDLFNFTICVVLAAIVIFIFSRSSTNYRLVLLCLYAFHPIVIRYWLFLLCFFLLPITYLEVVWP